MPINTKNSRKIQTSLALLLTAVKQKREAIIECRFKYFIDHDDDEFNRGIHLLENLNFTALDDLASVKRLIEADQFFTKIRSLREFDFPCYQSVIDPFFLQYAKMELALDALLQKSCELFVRGYEEANGHAYGVVYALRILNQWYFIDNSIDYNDYKFDALAIIMQALPVLAQHRGYKPLLVNLIVLIATLGTAFLVNKVVNSYFLFFPPTESAQLLTNLQQTLSTYKPSIN